MQVFEPVSSGRSSSMMIYFSGVTMSGRFHQAVLALLFVCMVGCGDSGPPSGTISGKVTLGGEPITSGNVSFYSEQLGSGAQASISQDGTYTLANALQTGEYQVAVRGVDGNPGEPEPEPTKVPKKYWMEATSGLTVTLNPGANTFDIPLE